MGLKINIAGNETDFSIVERQVETTAEGNQRVAFLLSNSQDEEIRNFPFPFDIPHPLPTSNSTVFELTKLINKCICFYDLSIKDDFYEKTTIRQANELQYKTQVKGCYLKE